jgi:hypothetical protein
MKIASTIARYLLSLVFIVFGLNGFLHFIPQPPPPSEMAGQYFTVMFASHYFYCLETLTRCKSFRDILFCQECRSERSLSWTGDSMPA